MNSSREAEVYNIGGLKCVIFMLLFSLESFRVQASGVVSIPLAI